MAESENLNLHSLVETHPGITDGISLSYSEAASVCLDRHHQSPVEFTIRRDKETSTVANWNPPSERTKKSWANTIDTTESGAYCLALATVEITDNLVAISRAETHTGADYYLGVKGKIYEDLEDAVRLEVSGVDEGGESIIKSRLKQKVQQAANGKSELPAIATVVGFKAKKIFIENVAQK